MQIPWLKYVSDVILIGCNLSFDCSSIIVNIILIACKIQLIYYEHFVIVFFDLCEQLVCQFSDVGKPRDGIAAISYIF